MMTKALGIVVDLRIPEALADGPRPVEELAREANVDADVLHRLLRALASDGVFEEHEPGTFALNAGSEPLLEAGWSAFAHLFGDVFYKAVADLDEATRTGAATFPDAFGTGFWPWLAEHPEEREIFDRAMGGGRRPQRRATRRARVGGRRHRRRRRRRKRRAARRAPPAPSWPARSRPRSAGDRP